jgi:hypothetical protein
MSMLRCRDDVTTSLLLHRGLSLMVSITTFNSCYIARRTMQCLEYMTSEPDIIQDL